MSITIKDTNLRELQRLELHSVDKIEFIKKVADDASKEFSIEMTLLQIEMDLEALVLKPMVFQGSFLLAEIDNDLIMMKECQLKAFSISQSAYSRRFKEQIERL